LNHALTVTGRDYSTCPAHPIERYSSTSQTVQRGRKASPFSEKIAIAALVIVALILYFTFMSISFDEVDAFNFALGIIRYDVSAHQPHPPGYPVFIFISSIFYWITNDRLLSLILVSALSGALALIPTYLIAKQLFNREIALFSTLTLMVVRGYWLLSEQALSDMLFTLLLTTALSMLLAGKLNKSKSHLYASWGILGIALGVRPFNLVLTAPFILETIKVGKRRDVCYCVMLLLGTLLLGLIPAVMLTGYNQYQSAVIDQLTRHVRDDVNPFGFSAVDRFTFLLLTVFNGLGANLAFRVLQFDPFVSSSFYAQMNFVLLSLLCLIGSLMLWRVRNFANAYFLLSWILPYSIFVYVSGALGYTRYLLPILPPIVMVLVASAIHAGRCLCSSKRIRSIPGLLKVAVRYWIVILLVVSMFANSLPMAIAIHTELPPNVQLATFVHANYEPTTTTIIVYHESRAFQSYAGEFRYVNCCYDTRKTLGVIRSYSNSSNSILITNSALDALQRHGVTLNVLKIAEFSRSPLVKVEDFDVILYRIYP